ncbi:KAT8 regulatory NSL complex subunit 1 isoform X3 [Danio rerio]|uniref:KAT8 regulatory NSL complex subunit 1 isoform X3 n=1 Tax=Danio rerio TaxID=7955 RepID=A0A8M3AKX5_DANRE|nr:KAT8 regulatory NSL complex subunit 1-like isoform X2 [Danio rerio]|eukprot:XP_009292462.1 KAT8 regulatory NSL complex subunit 1-like isoform X2 [Danio rerio]
MYYYCNRNKMSTSAVGPGVESCGAGCPHSASRCCGGGGCGETVSGDGSSAAAATATSAAPVQSSDRESSVAEAQAFREWDCATSVDADLAQKMNEEGFFTNGAAYITREGDECADSGEYDGGRGRFCRQSAGASEDNSINIDHNGAGLRCFMSATTRRDERRASARLPPVRTARVRRGYAVHTGTERAMMTAAARCGHGHSEPAVIKRRGCSFNRTSKRVCFSGTYCGSSDAAARVGFNGEAPEKGSSSTAETVRRTSSRRIQCENTTGAQKMTFASCVPEENTKLPTCRTAKGRVRLYRVRSFLASSANHNNGVSGNGAPHDSLTQQLSLQAPEPEYDPRDCIKKTLSAHFIRFSQSESGPPNGTEPEPQTCESAGVGIDAERTEGPSTEHIEAVRGEAERRQAELEGRTDHLWRRLQAVQVKQVERHVKQQLSGLYRRPGLSCTRRPSAVSRKSTELSRLARSCSEILRTAESALDSDHTASSSGGGSDIEEDEGLERGGHRFRPSIKSIVTGKEWQWAESRAWLGSRWVWLQTQVSELEYRIRALTELYTHLRQGKVRSAYSVPDTPLRASNPSPTSHNCKKWQTQDTITPQTVPSPPSSAARVRPLLRQRRHRLIRLKDCAALGSKAVSLQCWCEAPAVCVLCGGAPPRSPSEEEKGLWRQTWLDMSVHPVLSMPSDSPISLHCGNHPLAGHHSHNSLQWTDLSSASSWLGRRGQGRVGRVRRRLVCPRPPNALPPLFNTSGGSGCRSQRSMIIPNYLHSRTSDLPILPAAPPATDTPAQPLRRRRVESSFDIDNLVMPLGLAGLGARVQRLQYKEIITPSWRELDSLTGVSKNQVGLYAQSLNYNNTQHQPNGVGLDGEEEEEEEVEDLSDTVFLSRHAVCESRERSRWGSWARRRRRGRSSSSYQGDGKSSRGLDQTPGSPDSRHFAEGDVSPCSPFCTGAEDPFSQAEDEQQAVLPWERRSFPLEESELQWLQEEEEAEPDEDPCTASGRSQSTDSGISVGSLELSPRTPQQHSGTDQTTSHTLSCKPATQTTLSTAQDSPTLPLSLYSSSPLS